MIYNNHIIYKEDLIMKYEVVGKTVPVVQHGVFGADMKISLENDGPFTVILDESIL